MSALAVIGAGGFLRRVGAMLRKELLQLRRDRVTLATMISIPLLQLTLFGYAINTTPRNLPTAVLLQESSDVGRSILAAIQNTKYFKVTRQLRDEAELDEALKSGQVLFAVGSASGARHKAFDVGYSAWARLGRCSKRQASARTGSFAGDHVGRPVREGRGNVGVPIVKHAHLQLHQCSRGEECR